MRNIRWQISLATLATVLCTATPLLAQQVPPRFGIGFSSIISTQDALGFGMRGRVSAPVSTDLSLALDVGFGGFFLSGRDDATWVFMPQVSGIVTLDGISKAPYLLGGIGGYFPLNDTNRSNGGPMLHGGMGWVRKLNETSIYYEIDPGIVIEKTEVELVIPVRIGVIF